MKIWPILTGVAIALTLVACKSPTPPKGVQPINNFDASRYLGKWYEVARLENRLKQKWSESEGKAYFTAAPTTAALKVSFFGPFYGGYNVIALDSQYQYALVSGPDRGYLWILSRTPTIPESIKQEYLSIARDLGFPVEKLVWVNHG
ncbi:MAG: lipocalin family protein [Klebsiella michiganensis]|nr:lipocalin family protein [Klebsiella michiganensis]